MDMMTEPRLCVGDIVELRPSAPVPPHPWLQPGLEGRVVMADATIDGEPSNEITVLFAHHAQRPIRLHRRWVRFLRRPKGRGRPWQARTAE
jgi:hypothetical protein